LNSKCSIIHLFCRTRQQRAHLKKLSRYTTETMSGFMS
jgi:hypothetical protein